MKAAQWDTNYYPGSLYAEIHTASVTHPLQGSGSAKYDFTDGSQETLSLIAYQDFNPKGKHAGGSEHWNFELRAESLKGLEEFALSPSSQIGIHRSRDYRLFNKQDSVQRASLLDTTALMSLV